MSAKWNKISKKLVHDKRSMCVLCAKNSSQELAHMPYHKRYFNSRKFHKYIDVEQNAIPICLDCKEFSETREGRMIAVDWLRNKFDNWDEWYHSVPAKIKERF